MSQRLSSPNKNKLRNLVQYRDLSDEEFEEKFQELLVQQDKLDIDEELDILEERISKKINDLGGDYALEDMKANDMVQLRALVLAMIQLEDLEKESYLLRKDIVDEK
jgi:hypothetical protein